jgi:hypothetical protein
MRQTSLTPKRELPSAKPGRSRPRLWTALAGLLMLLGGVLVLRGAPSSWQGAPGSRAHSPAGDVTPASQQESAGPQLLDTQRIDTIQLGTRLRGRNPIREEVELVEPDPATWRKISLYMTKESGLGLWIELLRPLAWIEAHEAEPGGSIYLDMHEMGAVGDAKVMDIGPCPAIQPGDGGAVVTGRFKHEADANSGVVHLELEDQIEPTGVTDNHPYWSVDRQEFIPVGQLHVGELVDTIYGLKRVVSVTPIDHNGFLYNLETTEHVYRVGSLGTLVHNICPGYSHLIPRSLGSRVPYQNAILRYLNAFRHTKLHRRLSKHLDGIETVVDGTRYTMLPKKGQPGRVVREVFTRKERLAALRDFYRSYNGGEYYSSFLRELNYTMSRGLFE